jgi:hypothetical protein
MSRFTVSPERHPVLSFEGPEQDLVFLEKVDMKQARNRTAQYGDPHWDATTYPNHKLVHIRPFGDGTGEFHAFYYAADRPYQDNYNWEYKSADIGGTKFDTVERTYVIKRADFEQEKADWVVGTEMPRLPYTNQEETEYAFPSGYILAETECGRIDEVMDGLFVAVKNTYIKRVVTSSNNFDEQFGGNLHSEDLLYYKGEIVTANVTQMKWAELTGSVYEGTSDQLILTVYEIAVQYENIYVGSDIANTESYTFLSNAESIDDTVSQIIAGFSGSALFNVSLVEGEIGKILFERKEKGDLNSFYDVDNGLAVDVEFGEFTTVTAGEDPRPSDIDVSVGYSGSTVDFTIVSVAGETASDLAARIRAEIASRTLLNVTGDGGFVRIERRGAGANEDDPTLSLSITVDPPGDDDVLVSHDGRSADTVENTIEDVFKSSQSSYWGLQVDGIARSGRQLSDKWFLVTESAVVPEFMTSTGRTYWDTVDFRWPNVLDHVQIDIWNRKDGGADYIVYPIWARNAYGGPCKAEIVETFHANPVATSTIRAMLDIEIDIITPLIQVRIPQSLHVGSTTQVFVGSEDPLYQSTGFNYTYPSTNFTDWPETLLVQSDIQPMRGGYLKRDVTIERPQ